MATLYSPAQNYLLAALPAADFASLTGHLELVPLSLGQMLYEPGSQMRHAYFPTTAIVSLHYVTESGASAETAGVGIEGVVGVPLFMGGDTTSSSAVVQTAGQAWRLDRHTLKQEFNKAGVSGGQKPYKSGDDKWRRKLVSKSGDDLWCRFLAADCGEC